MSSQNSKEINTDNTCWIFVNGSSESRHLYDVVFAHACLQKIGVKKEDIYFFIDHPQKEIHLTNFEITTNVFGTSELSKTLGGLEKYKRCIVVVAGHGSPDGICIEPTKTVINPNQLVTLVRDIKNIDAGIIVLSQCYAGLFNFVDAGKKEPQLAILGATNLNPSLSSSVTLDPPIKGKNEQALQTWSANIFMFHFFLWLKSPKDVDGDGACTLMDAYKYAGVHSNEHLRSIKNTLHFQVESLKLKQMHLLASVPIQADTKLLLEVQATQTRLKELVDLLYLHQEPWILHSNFARIISFSCPASTPNQSTKYPL